MTVREKLELPPSEGLGQFYDSLKNHDWYYGYSDDPRAYHQGEANMDILNEVAKQSPEHQALFDGFKSHCFSGEPWGTEVTPLPVRPDVIQHQERGLMQFDCTIYDKAEGKLHITIEAADEDAAFEEAGIAAAEHGYANITEVVVGVFE